MTQRRPTSKWTRDAVVRLGPGTPAFLGTDQKALGEARAARPATLVRGSAEAPTAGARIHAARGDRDTAAHLGWEPAGRHV
ncbi:hypothetical protein AB0M23_02635 [Streptomyces sp. NPDC052077]|uniref:hypothetical protein n=1 Tax=Streptomyces sp. NPDC052077 TaxID=3154757 RepID=UPI0034315BC0